MAKNLTSAYPKLALNKGIVSKLVFGGHGLVRHEGLVVFVDDVLDGEECLFTITEKKKSYAKATLEALCTTSPDRILPRCPHFGLCGGCQLQHIRYEKQLEIKRMWLYESLVRIGSLQVDVPISVHAARSPYGYRKKIVLSSYSSGVGYTSRSFQPLLIESCPIFIEDSHDLFTHLRQAKLAKGAQISLFKEPQGAIGIHILYEDLLPKDIEEAYSFLSGCGYRVTIEGKNKIIGSECIFEATLDGITYFYCPKVFIQNDPEHFATVYRKIIEIITCSQYDGPILDLYSGVGIVSLLLAQYGFVVYAIEQNERAVQHAKQACLQNDLKNAHFFCADVACMNDMVDTAKCKYWIVNPPRGGLSNKVKESILKADAECILYISCDPTTLARDLQCLATCYTIASLDLYDMFSQTKHFETVVCLRKT